MRIWWLSGLLAISAALAGCNQTSTGSLSFAPRVGTLTAAGKALSDLPRPVRPVTVAVYEFPDLTGQNKPNNLYADYSRAITQGASAIVADALKTAASGTWFNVVERSNLESLLRERKLIQDTYTVIKKDPSGLVSPLQFAEYLVTGGIVSFDAPVSIASASGSYVGIGGELSQTRNLVTINLRLVRVKDGAVIKSINVSRPIVIHTAGVSANRFLTPTRLLNVEAGFTLAEATQIAVRESIELGVYEIAREGLKPGVWSLPTAAVSGPVTRRSLDVRRSRVEHGAYQLRS